ncbi:MAG TPA: hypothetical protein VHM90_02100, partial [Phycisphaerae bacterium]|nr:hypothetical protein [Phycisphaerae bacterium]
MQRLLPAFTLSLLLATHAAAQTAPALPASLLKDLASDDFTTRSSAQKTLAQIPVSRREELEKIAAAATDPEVKARLLERVAAMEEETILALPTISLGLKNASLAEAAAALSKAANIPITGRDPNDNSGNPITLSKKDVSFSQLIEAIGAQTPLNLLPSPTGLNLVGPNLAARPQPLPPPKAFGPAVLFPQLSLSGQTLKLTITI